MTDQDTVTLDATERDVIALLDSGVPESHIILVDQHPDYPDNLSFEPLNETSRGLFLERHKDWVSRYLILNGLHLADQFIEALEKDGYHPVWTPSAQSVREDVARWNAPLDIEGYTLKPFQTFSMNRALERARNGQTNTDRFWFWNWAAGAGKSWCSGAGALELFNHDDIDLVIACTLSKLKINLCRTFQTPATLDAVVTDGTKAKRQKIYAAGHQVYVMNYEKLWHDEEDLTALIAGKRVLWVLDEASKLITDSTPNKARQALDRMVRACHAIVWPMSATVVGGNPLRYRDVFSLDGQEGHNPLSTKTDFIQRYADRVRNVPMKTRNGRSFGFTTFDWNLVKLQEIRHRVGDWTMAVRKTDPGVREQFRGIETIPMYVQATPGTEQLLGLILDSARQARDKGESLAHHYLAARIACINPAALLNSKSEVAADILARRPDLFDASHSGKIEVLNGMLEGVREAQDKAVVFCHWTELGLLPLAPHLTVPHVLHYATGQSAAESQGAQDRFKTDPDVTAFCSSDAGTYGLNLQEARYVISVDPTYSYDDLAQRNARIDRTDSHLDGLTAYVLITEDSVEERIWQICNERRAMAAAVQGTSEELSYNIENRATRDESRNLEWLMFGE